MLVTPPPPPSSSSSPETGSDTGAHILSASSSDPAMTAIVGTPAESHTPPSSQGPQDEDGMQGGQHMARGSRRKRDYFKAVVLKPLTCLGMAYHDKGRRQVTIEDSLRFINIAFEIHAVDPETHQPSIFEVLRMERAKFDKGYTSHDAILMSESVLDKLPSGLEWERFENPDDPPQSCRILNSDGTTMKLLGKLNARWWGNDEDRVDKEIFLRPFEAIGSPVFILPRGAPHRVVIGLETIRAKKLDKYRPLSICGGGEPHLPIKTSKEARWARKPIREDKSAASHKAQVTKFSNDSKKRKERKEEERKEEERRKEEESKKKKQKKQEEDRKKKEEEERKRKKKKEEEERKRP